MVVAGVGTRGEFDLPMEGLGVRHSGAVEVWGGDPTSQGDKMWDTWHPAGFPWAAH